MILILLPLLSLLTFTLATPVCTISSLRNQVSTPAFTLPYLNLATIAYVNESQSQVNAVGSMIPKFVSNLPPIPSCIPGKFNVVWGPSRTSDNANLAYIATYSVNNVPVFIAVVLRGTDTSSSDLALYQQVLEDFDATTMVAWSSLSGDSTLSMSSNCKASSSKSSPRIAMGTCKGLVRLLNLSSNGKTILQYLTTFYQSKSVVGTPLVVTGHSLGGCQSTAVSLYLDSIFNKSKKTISISTFPFAPSTAGNAAFAKLWSTRLSSTSFLYLNNKDVVPYGFWNVAATKNLWNPQITLPLVVRGAIDALSTTLSLGGQSYTHPQPQRWLSSVVQPNQTTWTSQLMVQHLPPLYNVLICKQYVLGGPKDVLDYPLVTVGSSQGYSNCSVAVIGH